MTFAITVCCIVPPEGRAQHVALSEPHGYPEPSGTGRLAVVGGGASLLKALPRLREWPGDIWGVNQTAAWLVKQGIPATFYTVCPGVGIEPMVGNVESAVLGDHCAPSLYEALAGRKISRVRNAFDGPGPTSAVAASAIALNAGYDGVTFFGCDSSYGDTSHVYRNEEIPSLMRVRCGAEAFWTKAEFMVQAQELVSIIRRFPTIFANASGGLLAAMLQHEPEVLTDA